MLPYVVGPLLSCPPVQRGSNLSSVNQDPVPQDVAACCHRPWLERGLGGIPAPGGEDRASVVAEKAAPQRITPWTWVSVSCPPGQGSVSPNT